MSRSGSHRRQEDENVSPFAHGENTKQGLRSSTGRAFPPSVDQSSQSVTHTAKSLFEQRYTPTESDYDSIAMTLLGMSKDVKQRSRSPSKKTTYKQQRQSVAKLNDPTKFEQQAPIWKRSSSHQEQVRQALEREKK
eukprot:gb/GECG01001806.1/.p1 GENE.gb/GECG01001806.1/~~gb/GECG01001806.1/.p1  ORF type:complete len:136 (+),score=19.94 gb/GECG01001806.1/:1-408(+)